MPDDIERMVNERWGPPKCPSEFVDGYVETRYRDGLIEAVKAIKTALAAIQNLDPDDALGRVEAILERALK